MKINFEKNGTTLTAHLLGELDQHSAGEVRTALEIEVRKESVSRLILDLKELSFMDSSGIGVFVGIHHTVSALGGEVEIRAKEGSIQKMLDLSGLSKLMHICVGGEYEQN